MQVLIIEDEQRVADFLARGLKAEGYFPSVVNDGAEALHAIRTQQPALVILDRMLPNLDGLSICQLIRAQQLPVRILMLSALGDTAERVRGLTSGADDYLVKPFAFEELLARLNNLANRKSGAAQRNCLRFAEIELDLDLRQVRRAGELVNLTARELNLLELLMRNPQKVLSRERILANVWSMNEDPLTNVVDVYIRRLRNKLDKGHAVGYVRTLRGTGYYLSSD
jgi:DNA-binding response OmpR family regulator